MAGHQVLSSSDPISSSNQGMWNESTGITVGAWMAAEVGQVNKAGAGGPTRWFKQRDRANFTAGGSVSLTSPYNMAQFGHAFHRNFMYETAQAALSGFFPLVQPFIGLYDIGSVSPANIDDEDQTLMPVATMEDFFLGDITNFEPGVTVSVGGVDVVPFPITSKLTTGDRTDWGGYFYRKRV
jgi:hypothetical protein